MAVQKFLGMRAHLCEMLRSTVGALVQRLYLRIQVLVLFQVGGRHEAGGCFPSTSLLPGPRSGERDDWCIDRLSGDKGAVYHLKGEASDPPMISVCDRGVAWAQEG